MWKFPCYQKMEILHTFSGIFLRELFTLRSFVIFFFFLDPVTCFNVDTKIPTVHTGESDSMFGFAVSQHIDQGSSWLLIGAPHAQTSQPGISRSGAVFRCPIDRPDSCREIPFDTTGNKKRWNGTRYVDIEDKSNQWFGATVTSSGQNGVIVACAPRYVYFSNTLDKREPVGTCYVARQSSPQFTEYSPCRTSAWGYHKQGYCQAGFSATLSETGERLLIGAPGSYFWQGQVYNYRFDDGDNYNATNEGPITDDDSYLGYASAVGEFNGNGNDAEYVVGIPRGQSLMGKIAIYDQNLTNLGNMTGEQIGAYFGAALAVQDLDGNDLDDIIVGAPLYSDHNSPDTYENGRVYIYYQNSKRKFKQHKKDILDGHHSKSRFGFAVTGLGDINYDGYNDLAVGAPFGGEDERGEVYIYHGSMKGIITLASQVIKAEDVQNGLLSFGYSLSGGLDLDGNQYPDLLIGCYESDKAIFLRTRPVVRVAASLRTEPEKIDLEHKACKMERRPVTCFTIYTCLKYDGIGVPGELYFDLSWKLDSLKNLSRRSYFMQHNTVDESNTVKLHHKQPWCPTWFGYIISDPTDKLTPVSVEFKFKLHKPRRSVQRLLEPILDQYIPQTVRAESEILKDCGIDNICIPDLVLTAIPLSNAHIMGRDIKLGVKIIIMNQGEDAFEAMLTAELPPGVEYAYIEDITSKIPPSCGLLEDENIMTCYLGNPLPRKSKTNFTVILDPRNVNGSLKSLDFKFHVNSSNPENFSDSANNIEFVQFPVKQLSILSLKGTSYPDQIIFNRTALKQYRDREGPRIEHLYELTNNGPSSVTTSLLHIFWPSHSSNGILIYNILEEPIVSRAEGSCSIQKITPYNSTVIQYNGKTYQDEIQDQFNDRRKRETASPRRTRETALKDLYCTKNWCTIIRCRIGHLEQKGHAVISVKTAIRVKALVDAGMTEPHHMTSRATAVVVTMPFDLDIDPETFHPRNKEVITEVFPERLAVKSEGVPIWIIAVSVSAGLLILLLLIVLLWWCGFFRRKRPKEHQAYKSVPNGERADIADKPYE